MRIRLNLTVALFFATVLGAAQAPPGSRVGIIGLDTSHSIAFAKILNDPGAGPEMGGLRVVAAYPEGSRNIESSASRIPGYTREIRAMGVEVVGSISELLSRVDYVLLETNDGHLHLAQALEVIAAGKPVFIDKPLAGDLTSAVAIQEAAAAAGVPLFSASGLRYFKDAAKSLSAAGAIHNALAWSPAHLEPSHPDLFWYGIHAVEQLYAVMGPGCESVVRVKTENADVVVGVWSGGRTGTVLGTRSGKGDYGGVAFGQDQVTALGGFGGYESLVEGIVRFFQSGKPPVSAAETLEIYTFMEAADESRRRGGVPVALAEVLGKARSGAKDLLAQQTGR